MSNTIPNSTYGPAYVGIGCEPIGCAKTVSFEFTESTKEESCDPRIGLAAISHYDPRVTITIDPYDFTMANLALALDSSTSVWGGTAESSLEKVAVTWGGSSGDWTSTVIINEEISGTVAMFTDSAGANDWASAESGVVTVAGPCTGSVTLTSSGTAEPTATLYATYNWGDQIPSGSTRIAPSFATTGDDRYLVVIHKETKHDYATVFRFWRVQIDRAFSLSFNGDSDENIIPTIKLKGLADTVGHSGNSLFDVNRVNLEGYSSTYQPYSELIEDWG